MSKACDTTRVPGLRFRILGFNLALMLGRRYMVMTVALEKSVSNRSAFMKVALADTPSRCALRWLSVTMSGLYSMPMAVAPNFLAAAITVRPSPEPRSKT